MSGKYDVILRSKYSQAKFKFLRIQQLATHRIQLQSRRTTQAKEASTFYLVLLFVFSLETWNVMAWDGLVQQNGKYRSIRDLEYPKFQTGIFGRNESALCVSLFDTMLYLGGSMRIS